MVVVFGFRCYSDGDRVAIDGWFITQTAVFMLVVLGWLL